ncbi:MAG: Tfp pilus assembly protein FimT/FimU [Chthoniobacteraceae bacterium]
MNCYCSRTVRGFTLIELLVVMAVFAVVATFIGPAIQSLLKSTGLTRASYDISSLLEQARTYAVGRNTYVYVGFQEVDSVTPTVADGVGRIVVGIVASLDGTRPYTTLSGNPSLPSGNLAMIDRLHYYDRVHLVDASTSTNGANMTSRPVASYDLAKTAATTNFQCPLNGAPKNRFSKVIEFDPQGVARVQTDTVYRAMVSGYIEISMVPANGNVAALTHPNQAAIQVDSMTGAVRLYRP